MKLSIFLILHFFCQISCGQTDSSIYILKLGWTLHIPKGFKIVDPATAAFNRATGKVAIEKTLHKEINDSALENLISVSKDRFNYMTSNLYNSDTINLQNWEEADQISKEVILKSLKAQIPNIKLDTTNSVDIIAGIIFKKLQITSRVTDDTTIYFNQLGTFYKNRYWGITYIYYNREAGLEIEKIFKTSTLEK